MLSSFDPGHTYIYIPDDAYTQGMCARCNRFIVYCSITMKSMHASEITWNKQYILRKKHLR